MKLSKRINCDKENVFALKRHTFITDLKASNLPAILFSFSNKNTSPIKTGATFMHDFTVYT